MNQPKVKAIVVERPEEHFEKCFVRSIQVVPGIGGGLEIILQDGSGREVALPKGSRVYEEILWEQQGGMPDAT